MRYLKILAVLVALVTCAWIVPQGAYAQQGPASFQLFYDDLSPYGMWVDYQNYGYVWIPNVEPGFRPYATNGYWAFTDDGWTWVSNYPWGWAPFHYGRWGYDNVYGWFWIPDNEWGPAWVLWRRSPGYYGWAPLGPGISMDIAFGNGYHETGKHWIFVRDMDITRPDISSHYIQRTRNTGFIKNSTVIVNIRKDDSRGASYIAGPDVNDVRKVTHTPVRSVVIREGTQPGQQMNNGELQIYRPRVQKNNGGGQRPAPTKVMKLNEVKPVSVRNGGKRPPKVNPADNGGKAPPSVVPPKRNGGTSQPQVNPNNNTGKHPPHMSPPKKNGGPQPSRPRATQPRQEPKKQDDHGKQS